MSRVSELYPDFSDWEELLELAGSNASKSYDIDFVDNMLEKTEQYGINTYCSEAQHERLLTLAGKG